MSYIVLLRNPRTHRLLPVAEPDGDSEFQQMMEFATEDEAEATASRMPVCLAWGYQIVEVDG